MANAVFTLEDIRNIVRDAVDGVPNLQKTQAAENLMMQVLIKEPDNWMFLSWMAGIQNKLGRLPLALALLFYSGQLRGGKIPDILNNMGGIYRRLNKNDRAREMFEKGLEQSPDDPDILNNLGTLFVNEGTAEEGMQYVDRAIKAGPGRPHAHWNRSLLLLEQEKFGEGFKEYVWGHVTKDRPSKQYIDKGGNDVHWWDGKRVDTLVVFGEQGVGDETMFLSMVPDIRLFCNTLILDIHPRLVNIMKRTFSDDPGIHIYGTRKEWDKVPEWGKDYKLDAKASLGTCAKYLRYDESLFPGNGFVVPNMQLTQEASWLVPGTEPLVGISWVGGVMSTRKDLRAIHLDKLEPIFRALPDARYLSLQYTAHGGDCDAFETKTGVKIHHFPDWTETQYQQYYDVYDSGRKRIARYQDKEQAKVAVAGMQGASWELVAGPAFDLDKLFSMINACDAIITVNQSNVWFGGALGKAVFTLTPSRCAWRYGRNRMDTVWFKSVRQYRQVGDDWDPAIQTLANDLRSFLL